MALSIQQRERESVVILDLEGRLVAGEETTQLRDTVKALQAASKLQVVLNLEGVDYIDSTGLGTLVMCHTGLEKLQGGLRLLNLSPRNLELLVLTKLTSIFHLYDDEQSAVNSFFPGRSIKKFDILSFVEQQRRK
jgi:anti-sigma B factor antagonist